MGQIMRHLVIGDATYDIPTNPGTVTSVAVSNATNGGLSVSGSPITDNGTITIGHSNVLTNAQATQAVYPIAIDKNGHISGYGTAVTIVNTRGTAASGGTTLSVVNTGDMYTWNNKVGGSGTNGYLAKWNGNNTITNGPQLTSGGTNFLREDGQWAAVANVDEKVKQTPSTANNAYEILFSETADNTLHTEGAQKSSGLRYNPSKNTLVSSGEIRAEKGVFNKLIATSLDAASATIENLTAQNATVVGLLDVQGDMHTNQWTNANIANIGGSFYITPTIEPTDNSTTISITKNSATSWTITLTGSFATDFIKTGEATSGVNWPQGSLVLVTGDIVVQNMKYPLGTLKGTLGAAVSATTASTSKTITINSVVDGQGNQTPPILDTLWNLNGANISGAAFSNGKISLYKIGNYPIGIQLSSMGVNTNSIIEIYGGVKATPNVRIGHLAGLPSFSVNGKTTVTPTGWGIYTDNGYFEGVIAATSGIIGGFTIGQRDLYNGDLGEEDSVWMSIGTTEAAVIAGSETEAGWAFAAGSNFGVTKDGKLYADMGKIGGTESYISLEKDEYDGTHYLDIRLNHLNMLMDGSLYGKENVASVSELIVDQLEFFKFWDGETVWHYYPSGYYSAIDVNDWPSNVNPSEEGFYELDSNIDSPTYGLYILSKDERIAINKTYYIENEPFEVFAYENANTEVIRYYYDENQFLDGTYVLTSDSTIDPEIEKEYFTRAFVAILEPFGSPFKEKYYEYDDDSESSTYQQYIFSKDTEVDTNKTYYELVYTLVENPDVEQLNNYYEPIEASWVEYEIFSEIEEPSGNPNAQNYYIYDINIDEYSKAEEKQVIDYFKSTDKEINYHKTYYTRSGAGTEQSPYVYTVVSNPTIENIDNYYEERVYYQMNEINLSFKRFNGLSRSFKFGEDSLGGESKLIITSAVFEEDEDKELASISVDPQAVGITIQGDDINTFGLDISYDAEANSGALNIGLGEDSIFNILDENNYYLNTTTGFKVQTLGLFHYKTGVAIGIV